MRNENKPLPEISATLLLADLLKEIRKLNKEIKRLSSGLRNSSEHFNQGYNRENE